VVRDAGGADDQTESIVDGWMSEVEAGLREEHQPGGRA